MLRSNFRTKTLSELIDLTSKKYEKISGDDSHKNNFFERLQVFLKHFPDSSIFDVLSKLYNYPTNPMLLDKYLTAEEFKTTQLKNLLNAVKNSENGM